jgi:hypothetical protein
MPRIASILFCAAAFAGVAAAPAAAAGRADLQETLAITQGNGDSSHPVISQDRRYSTVLAFESDATDLVGGDTNGLKDIFMVRRAGHPDNEGSDWEQGATSLVSKGIGGAPANGPSWGAAIDGGFPEPGDNPTYPKCIAFLSDASNLVAGDTNGVTDAFVSRGPGGAIERVSLPGGNQSSVPAGAVTVSIDCSHIAWTAGGRLYERYVDVPTPSQLKHMNAAARKAAKRPKYTTFGLSGTAAEPQFSTGQSDDLVVAADAGVYLIKDGVRKPQLVAPGGRNPSYNDVKCRVIAYEVDRGGATQVAWRYLGPAPSKYARSAASVSCRALDKSGEQIASKDAGGDLGDGDSTDPAIGNSGFYISFQSEASNLGVNALGRSGDFNDQPDAYLYTAVRDLTLVQSVEEKAVPLDSGGTNPAMSWYANYIFFDTVDEHGVRQILMRYLGPV